jgi:hypothetical protein
MSDFDPLSQEERDAEFEAGDDVRQGKPRDPRPFVRSSFNAPPPSTTFKGKPPARTYLYPERDGAPALFVERFEWQDPEQKKGRAKRIRQHSLRGDESAPVWVAEGFPDSELLPLFNLPNILANPDKPIVFVEGEKSVEAARVIFGDDFVVTTTAMGAGSLHRTDLSPVAGRSIIIFPDNDATGAGYARGAAAALAKLGCEIRVVDVAELVKVDGGARGVAHNPDGWDIADAVVEWTDPAALRDAILGLAEPYTDYTTVPERDPPPKNKRDDVAGLIAKLRKHDEKGTRAVIAAAVRDDLSEFDVEGLLGDFAKALGVTLPTARKLWKGADRQIRDEMAKDAAMRAERERKQTAAKERERLWPNCRAIAESPTLLADMVDISHRLGLVGESASLRASYLSASSRFNPDSAISLLRRGAPAGGKNYLIDKTLTLIPDEDIIHVSSSSPLALVYYGGGDEDALKYKIIYVPEAAVIAEKNGVESPLTIILRMLISEQRIDHIVVLTQPEGPPITIHVKRNGPVVVIVTSARPNVEDELLTRLFTSEADESFTQTENVVLSAITAGNRPGVKGEEIRRWLDYQRWLKVDAPYWVAIPFAEAIAQAFRERWAKAKKEKEKQKIQLRLRRDAPGFMTAIRTSAILHKAQRGEGEAGRIVATLDDYRHAHEAFDEGLAGLYKAKIPVTALAVVKAIEDMGATETTGVKVTVGALMLKLGITGRGTASARIHDAEERGFIELVEKTGGYSRTAPHEYKIVKPSSEIAKLIEKDIGGWVFPPATEIEAIIKRGALEHWYSGQVGTVDDAANDFNDIEGGRYTTAFGTVSGQTSAQTVPTANGTGVGEKGTQNQCLSEAVPPIPLYQTSGEEINNSSSEDTENPRKSTNPPSGQNDDDIGYVDDGPPPPQPEPGGWERE